MSAISLRSNPLTSARDPGRRMRSRSAASSMVTSGLMFATTRSAEPAAMAPTDPTKKRTGTGETSVLRAATSTATGSTSQA